jgi:hypothetical protein
LLQQFPEKIALADGSEIMAVPGDDGNGGISVVTHFLQSLTECVIVMEICDTVFG